MMFMGVKMDIEKEREEFESWWEWFHNGRQIACDYVEEDNSYSVGYANAQWVAWQAKAQAVPEWISVNDELPELQLRVLLFDANGFGVLSGRLGSSGWYLEGKLDINANVTHWMPLPKVIEAHEENNN